MQNIDATAMNPCNQNNEMGRTELKNDGWAKAPPDRSGGASVTTSHHASRDQQPRQIQVNSTIDADIVLRRVIEDRAAIIALKSRAAENEVELMRAKARQLNVTRILERQDQEIARLTIKAKRELAEYNEMSKQYILAFMYAFEKGGIDKLPHHPFSPSLEELEKAIDRRKAMLIEKVQADDRVKKLEYVSYQERVTMKVMKKNEEAFLRAIDIAKQQFSESCGTWLDRVKKLLSPMPHHAQKFDDVKKNIEVQDTQAQASGVTCRYPPPPRISDVLSPRYPPHHRRVFPQRSNALYEKKVVSPQMPTKKTIENWSPERTLEKMHIDNPQPMDSELPKDSARVEDESAAHQGHEEAAERQPTPPLSPAGNDNKRQKTDHQATPGSTSHGEDCDSNNQAKNDDADSKVIDPTNAANAQHREGRGANEEMSIARVLTSLNNDKASFAVAYI